MTGKRARGVRKRCTSAPDAAVVAAQSGVLAGALRCEGSDVGRGARRPPGRRSRGREPRRTRHRPNGVRAAPRGRYLARHRVARQPDAAPILSTRAASSRSGSPPASKVARVAGFCPTSKSVLPEPHRTPRRHPWSFCTEARARSPSATAAPPTGRCESEELASEVSGGMPPGVRGSEHHAGHLRRRRPADHRADRPSRRPCRGRRWARQRRSPSSAATRAGSESSASGFPD